MFLTTSTASTAEIITTSTNATKEEAIEEADSMVLKFGFVQSMGVIFAPISGFVIDKSNLLFEILTNLLVDYIQ